MNNTNTTATNVIARREKSGKETLWICEPYLCTLADVTEDYLRQKCRYKYMLTVPAKQKEQHILPDTGASWRWAKMGGMFWYDYDRIPAARRQVMPPKAELMGSHADKEQQAILRSVNSLIQQALQTEYRDYLHLYAGYSDKHCTALAQACAVLVSAARHILTTGMNTRKNYYFQVFGEQLDRLEVKYLPANFRRLKEKILAVAEGKKADELIDLPRAGNANALRLGDTEVLSWMMQLRMHPRNYTNSWIIRKIRNICLLAGKATPSESWFEQKFAEHENKWLTYARFGSGRQSNALTGYVPMQNAVYAGDCWQGDGTRVNFIPYRDANGDEKSLYIIAIVDVYSGCPVGWHFDTVENRWGYVDALKMAVNNSGHLPYELVIDRFPGHNTEEWRLIQARMEKEGTKVTITSKKTGKAKVERMFSTIQVVFMQDSKYYYGEGIQSRRTFAHRAPEYIKAIKQEAARSGNWNFDEACREATRILEMYRTTKYSEYSRRFAAIEQSPLEMYKACDAPHSVQVSAWDYVQLFGLEKRVSIRNSGIIRTQINKVEYVYQVDKYEVLSQHKEVTMCYDLEDLSHVYLFEATHEVNRKYLGEAYDMTKAEIYGPEAKMEALGKAKARIKEIDDRRKAQIEELITPGSEVELLLGAYSNKDATSQAETAWLLERSGMPQAAKVLVAAGRPPVEDDDEDDDDFLKRLDVRSMY